MGKRKSKRGRAAKNAQKSQGNLEPEELVKAPHSFVIHRGHLGKCANELMLNFRKVMEPFTAAQLKVNKHNVLKDFVHMAGPLNVTHMVVFTKTEIALYMRVIRLPRGPTLTFRIHEYSLARDVVSSMKKTIVYDKLFEHHPLLVLNNFSGEGLHFKLMTAMFQGMFPSININKTNLNSIRRCLLLNYNTDKTVDFRQYAIKVVPCGMSRAVKKLIQSKVPDLGNYGDVSEFLTKSGNLSESEVELDGPLNQVTLPQPISSRGNIISQKSAIRLYEMGPRMKLQLIKIEEGIASGEVLFHEYIAKTPEEIAAIKARRQRRMQLKAQRKATQEKNVLRKQQAKARLAKGKMNVDKGEESDSSDEEWYEKEVGEKPDQDVVQSRKRKKKHSNFDPNSAKRLKLSSGILDNPTEGSQTKKTKTLQEMIMQKKKRKASKMRKKRAKKKSRSGGHAFRKKKNK